MSATFNPTPFAEGRFRLAYKGTYTAPPSKEGKACVVKESKQSYTWKISDWDEAVEIYKLATTLAKKYNRVNTCSLSIQYVDVSVYNVVSSTQGHPELDEKVLVEDYIPGNFTKWCNNYGYISPTSNLMPAFMHWSWVHSGGKMMIADLQGVKGDSKYMLTDPVILSNTEEGQYGCTDTGVEGMAMFFLKHTCNEFCSGLSRPTIRDVLTSESAQLQMGLISTSTAYSHELKIPRHLKQRMISIFPTIATRT